MIVQGVLQNEVPNFAKEKDIIPKGKAITVPQAEAASIVVFPPNDKIDDIGFRAITNGEIHIYVHGILTYDDVFGRHHWTTFCYYLRTDGINYEAYKEHNENDND